MNNIAINFIEEMCWSTEVRHLLSVFIKPEGASSGANFLPLQIENTDCLELEFRFYF